MTLEELKESLTNGTISLDIDSVEIECGTIENSAGNVSNYTITHGYDIATAIQCDTTWKAHNLDLFAEIEAKEYTESELHEVLDSIQTEDSHWDWFKKSIALKSDGYEWFFFNADSKPQGACVIYHPRKSELSDGQIFYIEFLAVAPWNRDCLIRKRVYPGVGSKLIRAALRHAVCVLGLKPGFSLHSLPQARRYYEKLKMLNISSHDKPGLLYFELDETEATEFLRKP